MTAGAALASTAARTAAVVDSDSAYAASHPQWKHGAQAAAGPGNPSPADGQLRTAEPRPAARARDSADHDATPEKHAKLAA
jgi:hypothetical protein